MAGGTSVGNGQGAWSDTPRGPTWRDVHANIDAFEREYDVEVHIRMLVEDVRARWAGSCSRVDAIALRVRGSETTSVAGSARFGGNSGARTMPGAIIAALYDLEERMVDPGDNWGPPRYACG